MSDACQAPTIKNLKHRITRPVLLSPSNSRNVFCRLECRRSKHNILSSHFTKSQKNKCTCSWYQVSPKACCEQVIQHSREPELHKQNSLAKLWSEAWNYSTRIKLCSILLSNCSCMICSLLRLDLIVTLRNWNLWGSEACWTFSFLTQWKTGAWQLGDTEITPSWNSHNNPSSHLCLCCTSIEKEVSTTAVLMYSMRHFSASTKFRKNCCYRLSKSNLRRARPCRRRFRGGLSSRAFTGAPGISWSVLGLLGGVLGEQDPSATNIWGAKMDFLGERSDASSSAAHGSRSSAVLLTGLRPMLLLEDGNPQQKFSSGFFPLFGSILEPSAGSMTKPGDVLVTISTHTSSRLILSLLDSDTHSSLVSVCKMWLSGLDTPSMETAGSSGAASESVEHSRSWQNRCSFQSLRRSTDLKPATMVWDCNNDASGAQAQEEEVAWMGEIETALDITTASTASSDTIVCCDELHSLHFFKGGVISRLLLSPRLTEFGTLDNTVSTICVCSVSSAPRSPGPGTIAFFSIPVHACGHDSNSSTTTLDLTEDRNETGRSKGVYVHARIHPVVARRNITSNQLNKRKEVFSDSSVWQCGIIFFCLSVCLYLKGRTQKTPLTDSRNKKTKQTATKNPIWQHQIEELTKKSKRTSWPYSREKKKKL